MTYFHIVQVIFHSISISSKRSLDLIKRTRGKEKEMPGASQLGSHQSDRHRGSRGVGHME